MWTKEELEKLVERDIHKADNLLPDLDLLYDKVARLQVKFARANKIAMVINDPYLIGETDARVRECDRILKSVDHIANCISFIKEPLRKERVNEDKV